PHLFRFPRETSAQEIAAAAAERGARSQPDAGLVDEPQGKLSRVGLALHPEKQIERALRQREPATAGRRKRAGEHVPAHPRPREGCALSQPMRQPVIAQCLENVLTNSTRSSGSITSRNDGARSPAPYQNRP